MPLLLRVAAPTFSDRRDFKTGTSCNPNQFWPVLNLEEGGSTESTTREFRDRRRLCATSLNSNLVPASTAGNASIPCAQRVGRSNLPAPTQFLLFLAATSR